MLETLSRRHEETVVVLREEMVLLQQENARLRREVAQQAPKLSTVAENIRSTLSILTTFLNAQITAGLFATRSASGAVTVEQGSSLAGGGGYEQSSSPGSHVGPSSVFDSNRFLSRSAAIGAAAAPLSMSDLPDDPEIQSMVLAEICARVLNHAHLLSQECQTSRSHLKVISENLSTAYDQQKKFSEIRQTLEHEISQLKHTLADRQRELLELRPVAGKVEGLVLETARLKTENESLRGERTQLERSVHITEGHNTQLKLMNDKYFVVLSNLQKSEEDRVKLQKQLRAAKEQVGVLQRRLEASGKGSPSFSP